MSDTLPTTMRASVLTEVGAVSLQEVPVPPLETGQVLVRIDAVGVCGSDTHFYERGAIGDLVVRGPVILGHECGGEIVAVGGRVDRGRIGERVAVEPQTPCRHCEYCKKGQYHLCAEIRFYGAWPVDGSFSDYVVIDADFAHPVPEGMSAEQAALVEPVAVAVHACRRAGIEAGMRVLITGAGPIGALITQVAKAFGAVEVVVSDPVANRREFVLGHGADAVLDPTENDPAARGQYFDVYIDASGNARAILSALPAIRRGGTAVLVGMGGNTLEIPVALIQHREITLTGTYRYVNAWPTAIALVAGGRVQVDPLVTGRYGLDAVDDALMAAKTDPLSIKAMVIPSLTAVPEPSGR